MNTTLVDLSGSGAINREIANCMTNVMQWLPLIFKLCRGECMAARLCTCICRMVWVEAINLIARVSKTIQRAAYPLLHLRSCAYLRAGKPHGHQQLLLALVRYWD
jgi:hypothetical protein